MNFNCIRYNGIRCNNIYCTSQLKLIKHSTPKALSSSNSSGNSSGDRGCNHGNNSSHHPCQRALSNLATNLAQILLALTFCVMIFCQPAHSLDLQAKDISTSELLRILAAEAQQNLVISDQIDDTITLNLRGVQWQDALQTIIKLKGLKQYQQNNVTVIMTAQEAMERQQELTAHQHFTIKHIPVERLLATIQNSGLLSSFGKIATDTNSNSLLITDRADNLQTIERFVRHLDRPIRQIIIEARIVSINSSVVRDLGIELTTSPGNHLNHGTGITTAASNSGSNRAGSTKSGKTARHHYPHLQASGGAKNTINLSLAKIGNFGSLDLKLSALENDGLAQVISSPKLVTVDHQAASIETGAEIPYQETGKDGYTNTIFKKAVLSLTVTPELITENQVNMNITLNQDKVGVLAVNGQPTIDTRKVQTQAIAKNNETVVIGGIYEWSHSKNRSSMPILGELPLIKMLFSRDSRQLERRELLIFITPRIIQ